MDREALVGYSPWDHKESDTTEHTTAAATGRLQETSVIW